MSVETKKTFIHPTAIVDPEAEIGAGEAIRQTSAQDLAVTIDGRCLIVERDREVAVLAADRAGV